MQSDVQSFPKCCTTSLTRYTELSRSCVRPLASRDEVTLPGCAMTSLDHMLVLGRRRKCDVVFTPQAKGSIRHRLGFSIAVPTRVL